MVEVFGKELTENEQLGVAAALLLVVEVGRNSTLIPLLGTAQQRADSGDDYLLRCLVTTMANIDPTRLHELGTEILGGAVSLKLFTND